MCTRVYVSVCVLGGACSCIQAFPGSLRGGERLLCRDGVGLRYICFLSPPAVGGTHTAWQRLQLLFEHQEVP